MVYNPGPLYPLFCSGYQQSQLGWGLSASFPSVSFYWIIIQVMVEILWRARIPRLRWSTRKCNPERGWVTGTAQKACHQPHTVCISHFLVACDPVPKKKQLREGRFVLAHGGEDMVAEAVHCCVPGAGSPCTSHGTNQEAERMRAQVCLGFHPQGLHAVNPFSFPPIYSTGRGGH